MCVVGETWGKGTVWRERDRHILVLCGDSVIWLSHQHGQCIKINTLSLSCISLISEHTKKWTHSFNFSLTCTFQAHHQCPLWKSINKCALKSLCCNINVFFDPAKVQNVPSTRLLYLWSPLYPLVYGYLLCDKNLWTWVRVVMSRGVQLFKFVWGGAHSDITQWHKTYITYLHIKSFAVAYICPVRWSLA